jgi:hypothetical protein
MEMGTRYGGGNIIADSSFSVELLSIDASGI